MHKSKSRWLWLPALFGVALAPILLIKPHPYLLERATKSVFLSGEPYEWISAHELLCFHKPSGSPWELYRLDARTGEQTPLDPLTDYFDRHQGDPAVSTLSPDGKWLLWSARNGFHVSSLDGAQQVVCRYPQDMGRYWSVDRFKSWWQADSRHFICIDDRASLFDREWPENARKVAIFNAPELDATGYFIPALLTEDGRIFTYSSCCEQWPTRTVITLPLGVHAIKRKVAIHAPPEMDFASAAMIIGDTVALSPDGNRIAWICLSKPYVSPVHALLHRFIPALSVHPRQWTGIWVSRSDGGSMSEVGGIDQVYTPPYYPESPDSPAISDLRWLPDGKHLSFVYRDTLYTVPVD